MTLTNIGQQKTPGRPTEVTFAAETGLPSDAQEVLLIGHVLDAASGLANTVVTMNNVADLAAASGEAATKFGEGSELARMVIAAVRANAGGSTFPTLKCCALENGETTIPTAAQNAIKAVKAEFAVSCFDLQNDSANRLILKELAQTMSGAQRVDNNQFGTIGVGANQDEADPSNLFKFDTQFLQGNWFRKTMNAIVQGPEQNNTFSLGSSQYDAANLFQVNPGQVLVSVTVHIKRSGAANGTTKFSVWNKGEDDLPDERLFESSSINNSELATDFEVKTFTFSGVYLASGDYFIVVENSNTANGTGVDIRYQQNFEGHDIYALYNDQWNLEEEDAQLEITLNLTENFVGEIAAACAAKMAANGVPFNPLDSVTIGGLTAPSLRSDWPTVGAGLESESCLNQGWTPLYVKPNEEVAFVRTVTGRLSADGSGSPVVTAYYDVQDFQVLYFWRKTLWTRFSQPDLKQTKASGDVARNVKSEAIRLAVQFQDQNMFQSVDQLAKLFQVQRNVSDRHRFDVKTPVNVIPGLHVIATNVEGTTQFDVITV